MSIQFGGRGALSFLVKKGAETNNVGAAST